MKKVYQITIDEKYEKWVFDLIRPYVDKILFLSNENENKVD